MKRFVPALVLLILVLLMIGPAGEARSQSESKPVAAERIAGASVEVSQSMPPAVLVRVNLESGGRPSHFLRPHLQRTVHPVPPADGIQEFSLMAIDGPLPGAGATSVELTWETVVLDAPWLKGIRIRGAGETVKETLLNEDQTAQLRGTRAFIGVSESRSFDEALRMALQRIDGAMSENAVADASVEWRMGPVDGTMGGFGGLDEMRVIVFARRTPPWK